MRRPPPLHLLPDCPARQPDRPVAGHDPGAARGSYLCHDSYCNRYRNSARSADTPDSSTGNTGFRTVAGVASTTP
ncbi:SUMF1/EgtB/PvdO family nonheme iron enzyme [Catellatospora coxensis]